MSLPQTSGSQEQAQSSAVETFINDTSVAPHNSAVYNGFVDLSSVPAADFSTRLSIILNTYLQILSSPFAFLGDMPRNLSLDGPNTTPINAVPTWFGSNATLENVLYAFDQSAGNHDMPLSSERIEALDRASFVAGTANATVCHSSERYVCNRAWTATILLSSTLFFLLDLTNAALGLT